MVRWNAAVLPAVLWVLAPLLLGDLVYVASASLWATGYEDSFRAWAWGILTGLPLVIASMVAGLRYRNARRDPRNGG